jgi:excisionase family DNA binding protein
MGLVNLADGRYQSFLVELDVTRQVPPNLAGVYSRILQQLTLPTAEDGEQAKDSSRVLAQALANYSDDDRVRMTIQGSSGSSNELVLPGDIMNLMLTVLTQVSQGNAISLVPIHQEISTQQAAELLSVSRPHLVKLLEQGDIPYRKVGSHRRVKLTDVMDYRKQVDEARGKALDELSALSQDAGMDF